MEGSAAEIAKLANQVREWRRPIMVASAAPFRLCFRLEEPEGEKEGRREGRTERSRTVSRSLDLSIAPSSWYVRYLLQAVDDPSLLLPVADAWKAKGRVATAFK